MARAITQCDREARIQAFAKALARSRGHGRETQSRGGSLDGITWAGAVSNCKSARVNYRGSTSQIFGGGAASQDDVSLNDIWMM